jgi:hypothetical protein
VGLSKERHADRRDRSATVAAAGLALRRDGAARPRRLAELDEPGDDLAGARPYIDGSTDNSVFQQVFVYNGFGRLDQATPDQLVNRTIRLGIPISPPPSWDRLLTGQLGRDTAWLLAAAVITLVAGLLARYRQPRTDLVRAGLVLWGIWLVTLFAVFSAATTINTYYTAALSCAPQGRAVGRKRPRSGPYSDQLTEASGLYGGAHTARAQGGEPQARGVAQVVGGSGVRGAVVTALEATTPGAGPGSGRARTAVSRNVGGEQLDGPGEAVAGRASDHDAFQRPVGGLHGEPAPDLGGQPASCGVVLVQVGRAVKEHHRVLPDRWCTGEERLASDVPGSICRTGYIRPG